MKKLLFLSLFFPILANGQIIRLTQIADAAPVAITITGSFTPFTNVTGTASTSQSVGVAGTGLTNNIVIPAASGFEVSTDNATWTTSCTYVPSTGLVTGALFWARVKAATGVGSLSGNMVAASSPATSVNIPYSATVSPVPSLSASSLNIALASVVGAAGAAVKDTITFVGLSGSVSAVAQGPLEISLDGTTYASSQSFSTGSPLPVYTRISSATSSSGTISKTITYSASGVSPVVVTATGTISSSGSSSDTARFAMSATSQTVPSGFVSFFGDPSTGVRTATNQAGNITISTVSTANWASVSSTCAADADGLTGSTVAGFPDNILKAQMFTYSGSSHTADSANQTLSKPNFTVTGLNASATYHVEVTACLSTSFNLSCMNKYRILGLPATAYIGSNPDGTNGQFLVNASPGTTPRGALGNTAKKITFSSVTPDATGKISLYLFTESGEELGIISGIQVWKN